MATKEVYEITDTSPSSKRFDVEDNKWRVYLYGEENEGTYFTWREYIDADRVGVVGYRGKEILLPTSVILEAADAIRNGEVPKHGTN